MLRESSRSVLKIENKLVPDDKANGEPKSVVCLRNFRTKSAVFEDIISTQFVDTYTHQHQNGPDYVIPSTKRRTWDVTDSVQLNVASNGCASAPPISVVTFMQQTVDRFPNHLALAVKRADRWVKWSYADYWGDVCTAAKGFIKLGLKPFQGVAIIGFNAPEWVISHLGAIFAGGVAVGMYTTNSSEACFHVLSDSNASIVVVENEVQLKKILKIWSSLPNVKAIVQYNGKPKHPDVYSWDDLIVIGRSLSDEELSRRIKGIAINQCCTLIYTSGTTGTAKGVMLTHDNVIYFIKYLVTTQFHGEMGKEVYISYLPLSHSAAMEADIYSSMACAASVYFATPDALKGKLVDILTEVRPTIFFGVPRVWEKIYEKLKDVRDEMNQRKRNLLIWTQKQALAYNLKRVSGSNEEPPCGYRTAKKIVLSKVKTQLGLNKAKVLIGGGAPVPKEVVKFFLSLDIIIEESYGLSETAGPHVANDKYHYRLGSVGQISPAVDAEIVDPDESGNGEILLGGRTVFMGYVNNETATIDAINDDGWLHTGDVGFLDKDKFLFITGRIKELIITSGGENVAPVPIEETIKELLPVVSNCMLIGDKRKFLSMLITLKTEMNLDTLLPTDTLTPAAVKWCRERELEYTLLSDILNAGPDPKVMAGIQRGINEYNTKFAISAAQRIQKWVILKTDFSVGGEELGPTLKLKRPLVIKRYSSLIEDFYK